MWNLEIIWLRFTTERVYYSIIVSWVPAFAYYNHSKKITFAPPKFRTENLAYTIHRKIYIYHAVHAKEQC